MNQNNVNKIILVGAVIYLALPNVLWLFGWVETWIASIIGAFLIFGLFHWLAKKKSDIILKPISFAHVLPLALCCIGIVFLMGFNGIVPQPGDFIVRNALYEALINSDWPLYSNRGEYFVYYHAFVLLPALFASLFSSVPPWILIAMWVWLGLVLAFCCLAMRYRRRTMIFLVLLMVLGTPAAIFQLDHHFLANYWPIKDVVALYRHFLPVPLSYPGMWNQCADTYNHGIIALLFLSMMHGKLLKGKDVVLASGLVVACSPIAAPGILFLIFLSVPLASYKKVICDLLKMPLFYAELVLLSLLFTYYTSASNSTCSLGWNVFGGEFYGVYLASVCSFLLPLVVFGWKYRHTRSFVTIFILAVVLPVVWVGKSNNELLFKNCVLLYFILTAYVVGARSHVHRFKKLVGIFVLALCSYSFLYVVRLAVRDFEIVPVLREHNRHNEWQGSLNHPEHYMYWQFWGMHPGFPFKQ